MATLREIAENLNLSQATVSRALRKDSTLSIPGDTRANIFAEAERLGYVPKKKNNNNKKRQKNILVIHKQQTFRNQIDSSYYFSIRAGIEEACDFWKITSKFIAVEYTFPPAANYNGIIVIGNHEKYSFDSIYQKYKDLPIITLGQLSYYPDKVINIAYSNYDSVTMALNYLFDNGHENIGYLGICEAPGIPIYNSRKEIFKQTLIERGTFRPEWIRESEHGKSRVDEGYKIMKNWILQHTELPTALFCANDPVALGAMKALYEGGFRIPDDISIISHDGSYPAKYTTPPLTTIDVHPYTLGYESLGVLHQLFSGAERLARKILFYPELKARNSVKNITL